MKAANKLFAVVCSDGNVCLDQGGGSLSSPVTDEIYDDFEKAKKAVEGKSASVRGDLQVWRDCDRGPHVVVEYVKGKTWRMEP